MGKQMRAIKIVNFIDAAIIKNCANSFFRKYEIRESLKIVIFGGAQMIFEDALDFLGLIGYY